MDFYPEAIFVPLIDTATMRTENVSDIDEIIRTSGTSVAGNTALPTDVNIPQTISNLNTMAYYRTSDDTAFDTTYQWVPPITGKIEKLFVNICMIGSMTAHTDNGNFWDTVRVTITKGGDDNIIDHIIPTGLAEFDAVGEARLFIVAEAVWGNNFFVRGGSTVDIRVRTTNTKTITNVMHWGMVPFFPTTADSNSKFFSQSGIVFHISESARETVTQLGQDPSVAVV